MLDAAASGLPIIVSDGIDHDHVVENGLAYRMIDLESLCERLRELENVDRRRDGRAGARKMRERFTWEVP